MYGTLHLNVHVNHSCPVGNRAVGMTMYAGPSKCYTSAINNHPNGINIEVQFLWYLAAYSYVYLSYCLVKII
jgi:hypothetical protein